MKQPEYKGNDMWIRKEREEKRYAWSYIKNGKTMCYIMYPHAKADPYKVASRYKGYIYYKGSWAQFQCLYDNDLDILKLKCLIMASELGWNIDKVL